MKFKDTVEKLFLRKNMIVLLLVGIVIMVIPELFSGKEDTQVQVIESIDKIDSNKLEKTIKKIKGVNSVDVFISYRDNGSRNYAYDIKNEDDKQELEIKMSDDKPVIIHTKLPKVDGILAVINGENLDKIDFSNMIKAATGVPLHRICVKISEGD